jgi:hypothetical protein
MHPWIPPWNGNLSTGQASSSPIAVHLVRGLVHVWAGAPPVVRTGRMIIATVTPRNARAKTTTRARIAVVAVIARQSRSSCSVRKDSLKLQALLI